MKKNEVFSFKEKRFMPIGKILKIMKVFTFLMLVFAIHVSARSYSQNTKLSMNLQNVSIKQVLAEIEDQTEFRFLYSDSKINVERKVNVDFSNKPVEDILSNMFEGSSIEFKVVGRQILLSNTIKEIENFSSQQQKSIYGKVTDASGVSLPGVSVVVKGTTTGVITDMDGKYSLSKVPDNSVLLFSFVGMKTQEITVEGKSTINVILVEESIGLDEVVAIGYGTQKKKDITGSVASITDKNFADMPMSNLSQALIGQIPGLDVVASGNNPGDGAQIRLRGQRSFVASNDPLIILDGIPFNGSINDINPYDIKAVDVLKDASSTSIYGSLGANGVILITTKRGEIGSPKFMLESYVGSKVIYDRLPTMTGEQFAERGRESFRAAGSYTDTGTNDGLDKLFFRPVEYNNLKAGKWTDYQDLLLQNGKQQKHQLSVMGGTKAIRYNIAGNVLSEEGIIPSMKFERYSLRTNLDIALTSKVNIGASTLLTYNIQNRKSSGALTEALRNSPLGSPIADDGTPRFDPADDGYRVNPMSDYIWDSYRYDDKHWSANINVFGEVKILPELTYRINLGNELKLNTRKESAGSSSIFRRGQTTFAQIDNSVRNKKLYESILTYDKEFNGDHHFTVTAVHSIQSSRRESSGSSVSDLPYVLSRYNNIGSATVINGVNSDLAEWNLISYVGRVNYGYKSKYLMTLSVRADGASQFSPTHKWGYFPSAALGWRISEENFMKSAEWITNMKLRFSYGVSGNQAISPYQTQGSLANTTYAWDESAGYGLRPSELANKNLKWESTSVYNIGLDFGFLNGRISGNLELYNTDTYDLLMFRKLPITSGFDQVLENIGKTNNKGLELGLHTINIKKSDFGWNSDFSFYLNREQIVELYNGKVDDIGNTWFIGQPIYVYYDYKKIGIWQTEEAATAATFGSKPGDIKLFDKNPDGKYTDADRMIVGTREPKFVFDLTNSFKYKNWDLAIKTYTRWGNTIAGPFNLQPVNRENQFMVDYWTPTNPTNEYPRPDSRSLTYTYGSTLTYKDGSFIRLRQLSLGYTLPKSVLDHVKITNARIYLTGENLWYWTKSEFRDLNIEPESAGDAGAYPASRTFMAGINITF